jgi:hypothetical protein
MPTLNDPNGQYAKITDEGNLACYSIIEPKELHVNEDHGRAFSVLVDVTTASTDDDFFYLKNNDDDILVITKIEGWCDDANQEIKILLGATDAGTDVGDALTPVAANVGSGEVPDIDCSQDATDLAITGGSTYRLMKFPPTALTRQDFHFPEGIILPKNTRLHMEASLAGLINLNIFFHYHS